MSLRNILIATLLVAAAGCGGSTNNSMPLTPSPTTPSGPTSGASIVSGAFTMTTTAFAPNPINVAVGTTVTWTNNDSIAHTSTANAGQWSSGTIAPGGHFAFTFATAGTYAYHCTIHPNMVGTVTVQ